MGKPWRIEGFVTDAGNTLVQNWWYGIPPEDREGVRDILNYLVLLEKSQWMEPYFKWFGKMGEIRMRSQLGALRIYGTFDEERRVFIFLEGHYKKSDRDTQGINTAEIRHRNLKAGRGKTHEFDFEDEPTQKD
jgi:hypothetical protein